MLKRIELTDVGPSRHLVMDEIAPRINLITGDNGLGKTFILDVAWWALTNSWVDAAIEPARGQFLRPAISFTVGGQGSSRQLVECEYDRPQQVWTRPVAKPPFRGVALYARADGSFAVWDFIRTQWRMASEHGLMGDLRRFDVEGLRDASDLQRIYAPMLASMAENYGPASKRAATFLSPKQVLEGVAGATAWESEEKTRCAGLLNDWILWQARHDRAWKRLEKALALLSPDKESPTKPGKPTRLFATGSRDIPTIRATTGLEEPVVNLSSAWRRIVGFAYLIVWALEEHERAAKILGVAPANDFVILFDELEAHLHPTWQRTVLRTVSDVVRTLAGSRAKLQLLATTHSPLVLASAEPLFDSRKDALWKLDFEEGQVKLERDVWHKRGDAEAWFLDVFDLPSSRSVEAQRALEQASLALRNPHLDGAAAAAIDAKLRAQLSETDPFWARWHYVGERKGWTLPSASPPAAGGSGR